MLVAGLALAFIAAAAATFLDCYFTMAKSLPRVPGLILVHPAILGLSTLCGMCAVVAFAMTDPAGNDMISTAITLKQSNPVVRGVAVGAMVLVLIRRKLLNVQESGLGGDAIYTLLRCLAPQAVNDARRRQRIGFLNRNLAAAFAIPNYFNQIENSITAAMHVRSPELQQRATEELKAVKTNRPASPMDANDPVWINYHDSMTGVCFDCCATSVLRGFPGFRV
jgi:hypothetical protein